MSSSARVVALRAFVSAIVIGSAILKTGYAVAGAVIVERLWYVVSFVSLWKGFRNRGAMLDWEEMKFECCSARRLTCFNCCKAGRIELLFSMGQKDRGCGLL